jgi:quinol monooxygenase YgiN
VIQTVLKIKVPQLRMEELVRALKSLMVSARAERGLVGCNLYQRVENQTEFCYVEDWQTADDAESQMRSNRYTRLLALMETAAESPSLEFHTVSRTQGLDYLQEVRNGLKS